MVEDNLLSLSYGRIVRKNINNNDGLLPASFETYQIVEPSDIIWRLTDLQNDKRSLRTALASERGIITSAYLATQPRDIQPDFLSYLLRAYDLTKVFYAMGGGLRQSMKFADVKWLPIMLPPAAEQAIIATFLDHETAKIDTLIEEQRRLIALLKEKRQAVISHAVTKGLDPNAPMKDSDIEWLGDVPAHWEVLSISRVTARISYGFTNPMPTADVGPFMLTANDIGDRRVRYESARCTTIEAFDSLLTDKSRPRRGDVLLTKDGTLGRVAVFEGTEAACINQSVAVLRTSEKVSSAFLAHALSDGVYQPRMIYEAGGTTIKHIYISRLAKMPFAVPPASEMAEIVQHCDERLTQAASLIDAAQEAMTLLHERRAALISAAVTGKINVCESGKVVPFPFDRVRARSLVAAEIIERSAHQATFGRVKLQKIAFLTEAHVGVRELAGSYTREAAGPLDRSMIDEMESGAQSFAGVTVDQAGGTGTTVSYRLGQQRGAHRNELADYLGADRTAKLDKLIADFAALTTKGAEAVATLYAVWNDALIEGASPTDEDIISGFLNDWHPEKPKKFSADELPEWLGWMRRHGIVPTGTGPKTATGRLFT